jgi:hemolysin III
MTKQPKQNEPLSSLTHFFGVLLSIVGLVLLVVLAVFHGTVWHVVGFSIFGTSLILLYLSSTLYHLVPKTSKAKNILRRIDHSMIYILIAGTYTPVCLVLPQRGWGWGLLGAVWGLAALGIIFKATGFKMENRFLTIVLYTGMGWLGVIALPPLLRCLPRTGIWWFVAGGILYTLGAVFYVLNRFVPRTRWFGMHEVFHVFVMAGSISHFWAMLKYVLYI